MNIKGVLRSRGIATLDLATLQVGQRVAEVVSWSPLRQDNVYTIAAVEVKPEEYDAKRRITSYGYTLITDTNGKKHQIYSENRGWGSSTYIIEATDENIQKLSAFLIDYYQKRQKRYTEEAKTKFERENKRRDEMYARIIKAYGEVK